MLRTSTNTWVFFNTSFIFRVKHGASALLNPSPPATQVTLKPSFPLYSLTLLSEPRAEVCFAGLTCEWKFFRCKKWTISSREYHVARQIMGTQTFQAKKVYCLDGICQNGTEKWSLPQCKNLWSFPLFYKIVRVRVHYVDFFVFFVLRHWWVSQVLTPRMSQKMKCIIWLGSILHLHLHLHIWVGENCEKLSHQL